MNKVFVLGRLGQTPDVKLAHGGRTVCNLSIATTERWTNHQGDPQERTEWHKVAIFGKLAETCGDNLQKGSQVLIEGRLQTRSWEKDGEKKFSTEIVAQHVRFLDKEEK